VSVRINSTSNAAAAIAVSAARGGLRTVLAAPRPCAVHERSAAHGVTLVPTARLAAVLENGQPWDVLLCPPNHLVAANVGVTLERGAGFTGPPGRAYLVSYGETLLGQVPDLGDRAGYSPSWNDEIVSMTSGSSTALWSARYVPTSV